MIMAVGVGGSSSNRGKRGQVYGRPIVTKGTYEYEMRISDANCLPKKCQKQLKQKKKFRKGDRKKEPIVLFISADF